MGTEDESPWGLSGELMSLTEKKTLLRTGPEMITLCQDMFSELCLVITSPQIKICRDVWVQGRQPE